MTRPNPNTRIFHPITARKLTVGLVAALVLPLFAATTNAQNNTNATDGSTPAGLAPGTPSGSYALSGFDNVNLYNGNMNFRLPLVSIGGRGGAGYTMMLPIEQRWTVDNYYDPFTAPSVVNTPNPNWWDVIKPGYSPGVIQRRQVGFMTFYCTGEPYNKKWRQTVTRLTFTANDGTEYELVDQLTSGAVHSTSSACTNTQFSRGKIFTSHDGSGATFISDSNVLDPLWTGEEMGMTSSDAWADTEVSGYLFLRDGTRYRISGGYVTEIRDRNGNKLTFTTDANFNLIIMDSLNRQVTVAYNYQDVAPYGLCDRITFKGFNGATRIIRVSRESATGKPTAVWLPNDDGLNRHYQFYYNGYSELRRVELPTGGAVEYDWDQGLTYNPPADFVGMFPDANSSTYEQQIYRRVVEKRVYPDGVTLASRTTFSRPETCSDSSCSSIPNLGYVDVDQKDASGNLLARQRHYFNGVGAANSMIAFHIIPPIVDDMEGRETQTEIYDFNGTTLLRRTVNTWEGAIVLGQGPRLTQTTTTLSDTNQVAMQTFTYDVYGNRTDAYEYDFGSGVAGPLIRRAHTDYLTTNPVNESDYACDRSTTCGPNANVANVIHIRSLPTQTSIYDAGGVERSRTTFEYDNYNSDTNHAPLVYRASISGLDSAFTTSYTTRGNGTATTHYLLVNGSVTGSITAYAQFDMAGNVVKGIDARGYATIFDFSDRFGSPDGNARLNSAPMELSSVGQASYAFPTLVTNALNQTAYAQFDYYLGKPIDGEDLNGIVASGYYNDLLDRPTQVIRAANQAASVKSQSTFSYDDTNRVVTSTSDRDSFGDNTLVSKVLYDKLGRTIETRQYEGGTNYIAVQTEYDALGRAYRKSNPFRPWQSETPLWLTTTFDALGRTLTATTADNAVVTTSYSGNTVTATDQAGKARKSVTDALGRMTSVYEDPTGFNYQTSYAYDVLNNLTTVTQGVQTRTFAYDSLKRLTSATNPESGAVSLSYDNNGNVLTRTDARGVVTTIAYDALNRPTAKSYNDGTPNVAYFYDSQTLPGGAPSFNRGYSIGALVAVTYGGGSAGTYRGYDVMGRVVRQYQQTDSVNYLVEASYSPSMITSESYPSVPGAGDRRTVTYTPDAAGRLASLNSNATTYAPAASVSSIGYASHNGLKTETYGNSLVHAVTYNNRLQPTEIKLGTSGNPTSILSLAYSYGTSNNNGNVLGVTYSGGGLSYTQSFGYDALNRLTTSVENGGSSWSQTNGYDRYSNRWIDLGGGNQSLYFNTSNNRISGWSYDASGNLLNDGVHSYSYDAENKIKTVDSVTAYTYDAEGQRVKKLVGENTRFVYGIGGELIAEFDGATGNLKKEYIHGGATLITIEPTVVNSNGTRYSTADGLGSPRVVTNSSASVVSRHDYLPFGEELGAGVGGRTTGMGFGVTDGVRQKFTGYEADSETGLNFAQARYHSATQGRFTSPDPLAASAKATDPQSWNRYAYVGNNPMVFSDPSGMNRGPAQFYGNNPEIDHARAVGRAEVDAAEAYYEDRLAGLHDYIVFEVEPIDGVLDQAQSHHAAAWKEPRIVFDKVEVLEVGSDPQAAGEAEKSKFSGNFILNVDVPGVDPNGVVTVRVSFHSIDSTLNPEHEKVTTTNEKNRRWDFVKDYVKPAKERDYAATKGTIIFRIKMVDKEGMNNRFTIRVGADYTASILDRGILNDRRTIMAETSVRLVAGKRDSPFR